MAYQLEPSVRREIEIVVTALAAKHLGETYQSSQMLLEPPSKETCEGDYVLGQVAYGEKLLHPFALRSDEVLQHAAIFGRSGSGKSNVAYLFLENFLAKETPFLAFDWKRNFRPLLYHHPDKNILVFTVGRDIAPFYFNPLIPPAEIEKTVWLKKVIEIICTAYFLGEGVAYLLMKSLDKMYSQYDCPTFYDLKRHLETLKLRGREALWYDSTMRAVATLCYGNFGKALNNPASFPMEALLTKSVILELDALTASDRAFFVQALILAVHAHRLQESQREIFKSAIVIEESHHVLLRKRQEVTGKETLMDTLLREIRELNTGVILLDQHPSLISKPALGNTYTSIVLNLKDGHDINAISECLLLAPDQKEYLGKLPVGWGIVKLQGRHFTPFLVKFDHVPINKACVSDEDVKRRMEGFYAQYATNSQEQSAQEPIREEQADAKEPDPMTEEEQNFLKDIVNNPYTPFVERLKRLNIGLYKANLIRDILIDKQIIQSKYIRMNKGRILIFELTEKGRKLLGNPPQQRRGGDQHEYYKSKISELYRNKGYVVITEYPIGGGKTVDVVAMNEAEKTAIEVETGRSDAIYNVKKCLPHFHKIISVVLDDKTKEELLNVFPNEPKLQILHGREISEKLNGKM